MPYAPFYEFFPELAEQETRVLTVPPLSPYGLSGTKPEQYAFTEMFCDEPGCDCRRVFFSVYREGTTKPQAVIAYGWETTAFYARWLGDSDPRIIRDLKGPVLNLGSPQSERAPGLLELTKQVLLKDRDYIERIKTHYRLFRNAIDKKKPGRQSVWVKKGLQPTKSKRKP